jgi:hypothetical protein
VAAIGLAVAVLIGGAWLQSYRVEVGHPGTEPGSYGPFLYREEVARAEIANGTLVVRQRHIDEPRRQRLSVVVEARVAIDDRPATMELRYREAGSTVAGVLVTKRGDDGRLEAVAPLPAHDLGDVRTYDVWLHLELSQAFLDSATLTIEVAERPEGQRARLLASR